MAKLYNGGASFGFSLNYNTAVPVDTRLVVASLADLKNPETWVSGTYDSETDSNNVYTVYPGLAVTVTSEKTVYVFVASEVNGETLAADTSWSKLSTASASGQTDAELGTVESAVGLGEDGSHQTTSGNYTKDATTVVGEIAALDTALKTTNENIGTSADTKDSETVYGAIAKVQDELDTEESKVTASATIKEVTSGETKSYETALSLEYVAATADVLYVDGDTLPAGKNIGDVKTAGVPAHVALVDKNNKELSTVEVSDLIGNGVLKSHSYDKTTGVLTLTFNTADGKGQSAEVDLSAMLDINDVLIAEGSANYLSVDLTGGENSQAVFSALIKKMADASYTEGSEATGLADAADVKKFIEDTIAGLDKTVSSDSTNVNVSIEEEDGKLKSVTVSEDYATVTRTAHEDAVEASEGVEAKDEVKAALAVTDGSQLATGSDIEKVALYADDKVAEEASRVDAKVAALAGTATGSDATETSSAKVTVKVDTKAGEVSGVTVTTSDIASAADLSALDTYVKGAAVTDETTKKVSGGIEKRIEVLEQTNADADFTSDVDLKDTKNYVEVKVAEGKDGKLTSTGSSVDVTYASYDADKNEVTDGVATGSLAKTIAEDLIAEAVDNLDIDAALEASDAEENAHITVSINQENGKIKNLSVTSSDIASAALLGTTSDTKDQATAFGKIAAEADARDTQIKGLNADKTGDNAITGTNVTVGVKEEAGVITSVTVAEKYATVTRVAKSDSATESLTVTDGSQIATGSDVEKAALYAKDLYDREVAARQAAIEGLDSSFDVKDGKSYVEVKSEIADGKYTENGASVAVTYGTFATGSQTDANKGIATVEDAKAYVDQEVSGKNVDAEGDSYVSASAASNKVTVKSNVVKIADAVAAAEGVTEKTGLADALDVKKSIAEVQDEIDWLEL